MTMQCAKCASPNADNQNFCGQCGTPLPQLEATAPVAVPGEEGAYYCARHKKEVTRVRCGRCETPICTRCAVHGPAGVRCRDCSRNRVPVRPMGVLHEVGRTVSDPNTGRQAVWYMVLFTFVLSFFSGIFGGRRD
jgi:hypothetical protein